MNTGEGKSTSSYAYTATGSTISCCYSGKQSSNHHGELRMSVNSQTSYSRTRKGADKSNKVTRERLLCKETANRWRLIGLGGEQGQLRQGIRKLIRELLRYKGVTAELFLHYQQDTANRVLPLKASGGELTNIGKTEGVPAATLKNSYTLRHGKW